MVQEVKTTELDGGYSIRPTMIEFQEGTSASEFCHLRVHAERSCKHYEAAKIQS